MKRDAGLLENTCWFGAQQRKWILDATVVAAITPTWSFVVRLLVWMMRTVYW